MAAGGSVDWVLAGRIATAVSRAEPLARSYHYDSLIPDFEEFAPLAEQLVEAETGLRSLAGPAKVNVVDRAGWATANLSSFQHLLSPLLDKLDSPLAVPFDIARHATRTAAAVEFGTMLGWMSSRVLGQYDVLGATGAGDELLIVGPNVLALEKRLGFPPREFRLWVAIHELTHRAQFTGVPWMRDHFLGLVHDILDDIAPDAKRVLHLVRTMARPTEAKRVVTESGVFGLFATPSQRAAMARIGGLMALLEGHGDIVMNRAGTDHVPSAERFHAALGNRRTNVNPITRLVRTVMGVEAKLNQYAQGEAFIEFIERSPQGARVIDLCWQHPDHLPTMEEIGSPARWLHRLGVTTAA